MDSLPPAAITIATEKRQAERRPLFCKVRMRSDTQTIECRSVDISKGGIAVIADINLALGQHYKLTFSLPTASGREMPMELRGKVVNVVLTKQRFRVGMSFVGIDMHAEETLDRFVNG